MIDRRELGLGLELLRRLGSLRQKPLFSPCLVAFVSAALAATAVSASAPVEVRVRATPTGPRLFVDGQVVRPRFYYGGEPCLCPIAWEYKKRFEIPFVAEETTRAGRVEIEMYASEGPIAFSDFALVDLTAGVTNEIGGCEWTRHHVRDSLAFERGHRYRYVAYTRASHARAYFTHKVSYAAANGARRELPLPYGDTLGPTAALAADAGVDFITFSTDSSWGCERWWTPDNDEAAYARIVAMMQRLVKMNPQVLLIPRLTGNAPDWMIREHPEMRTTYQDGTVGDIPSPSSRLYRRAACEAVEKLARYLQRRFPRNFAGLQVSGQNSAEWFYMNSYTTSERSGYDVCTRDAFRAYLKEKGAADWATAEVPSGELRNTAQPGGRWDPVRDARMIDFIRFRQLEIVTFLRDLGAAIRRGTDGKSLSLFFYGYTWEIGAVPAGAGDTGHFAVDWMLANATDVVDAFSAPLSYRDRGLTGGASLMSAAETISRRGILWINECDSRMHLEEFWDHDATFKPFDDPWISQQILKRESIVNILRGYGDWWMDLFARGWHLDPALWQVRKELNDLDNALLSRATRYQPEIAVVMDEATLLGNARGSSSRVGPLMNRRGFGRSGVTYGQYLLDDFLADVPPVKLAYLLNCEALGDRRARLEAVRRAHPEITFVTDATGADLAAEAIAARAKAAGCHAYVAPGRAVIESAEGYLMVAAQRDGEIEIDFGQGRTRRETFRCGEVKLLKKE